MSRVSLWALALLAPLLHGCEWVRLPTDGAVRDADLDGYDAEHDCDDFNAYIHPNAVETCNGVDNNCDGSEADAPDALVWYPDADADGYGNAEGWTAACEQPLRHVRYPYDCDDLDPRYYPGALETCTDAEDFNCDGYYSSQDEDGDGWLRCDDCADARSEVHPGAPELCNGRDDDCDGVADEDLTTNIWYTDADGDGWGDPSRPLAACTRPEGASAEGTDCDDTDPALHPDAPERCDGQDNDCDDAIDEPDRFGNEAWYRDADEDGHGDANDWVASCDALSGRVGVGDDCDDADPAIHPDAPEHCDDVDEDCDGVVDDGARDGILWYADRDADTYGNPAESLEACAAPPGHVADATDCDDLQRRVNPGATEACRGADEDCDGATDEPDAFDATDWYADLDGDGYGDPDASVAACTAPAGFLADDQDCDDSDSNFHPGALEIDCSDPIDYNCDGSSGGSDIDLDGWPACEDCDDSDPALNPAGDEVCNGSDDDCDGAIDGDASDGSDWYPDRDGDGFGDSLDVTRACSAPAGSLATAGDCDDADAAVSPVGLETCATAYDDDCDGSADDEGATGCVPWYTDFDFDTYGSGSPMCLCDTMNSYVALLGADCDDTDGAVNPGATEACGSGVDDDCDGLATGCGIAGALDLAVAGSKVTGSNAGDTFGGALAGLGDLDGDGAADIVVGAIGADDSGADAGGVWLLYGGVGASVGAAMLLGEAPGDEAGRALSAADLDGDGRIDLAVGAPGEDSGGADAGAVYIVLDSLESASTSLSDAAFKLTGTDANDCAGCALVTSGDGDGDGRTDLLFSAYRESATSGGAGAVYLFGGLPSSSGTIDAGDARIVGEASGDFFGRAIADAGDTDGDGLDDLAVGAYGNDSSGSGAGAAYVFLGPVVGALGVGDAAATGLGLSPADNAGFCVSGGGDVDDDGYADLVVGAPNNDDAGAGAGAVYLVRGPVSGTVVLGGDATLTGEAAYDRAGTAVAIADFNADNHADVAVTSDGDAHGGVGAVHVAYGPLAGWLSLGDAEAVALGEDADDNAGAPILAPGDTDGDGYPDLWIGASLEDSAGADGGAVYAVPGGPGL